MLLCRLIVALIVVFVICVVPPMTARQPDLLDRERDIVSRFQRELLGGPGGARRHEFESKVLESKPKPKSPNKSKTNYGLNLRYGYVNWSDGRPLIADRISFQPERKSLAQVREFLSRENLTATPFDTDGLSPYLTTHRQVIDEAQRVHSNLFRDLFRGKKYAVLLLVASHENKGDSAITVGELVMLESMGIEVLFYVNAFSCKDQNYHRALELARRHPRHEVVIIFHGGGNIIGYASQDVCRKVAFRYFHHYQMVLLSQSIYLRGTKAHFDQALSMYCCSPNLTIMLRDRLSLYIARRLFNNGTRLVLAPDMAFHNGAISRSVPPYYDVSWLKRTDEEAPTTYARMSPSSLFPPGVKVLVWDWLQMRSIGNRRSVVKAVNVLQNGLAILQEGRVVVTDRLHGHIMSTLLDIPHVLLDNGDRKLSSYHNTWTRGLRNCRLADNVRDAARLALELLRQYGHSLPRRLRAADINETRFHD